VAVLVAQVLEQQVAQAVLAVAGAVEVALHLERLVVLEHQEKATLVVTAVKTVAVLVVGLAVGDISAHNGEALPNGQSE